MFRNQHGERNERLANRHRVINSSYRENVVPYRYNPNIQKFIDKDIVLRRLISLNRDLNEILRTEVLK
jgi:hypothetical protein